MKIKTYFTILLCTFLSTSLFAQVPQGFNYQAVALDDGSPVANEIIDVRFTVLEGGLNGNIVYSGTQTRATDEYGAFDAIIGTADPNAFQAVDWGSDEHHIRVDIRLDAGGSFTNIGTQQLWAVPYAMHAMNGMSNNSQAGGDVSGIFSNITVEAIQNRPISSSAPSMGEVLKWNGSQWAPASDVGGGNGDDWGNQVVNSDNTLQGNGSPGSPLSVNVNAVNTDNQNLTLTGNVLSISNGNSVTLPSGGGGGDDDATNEIQRLGVDSGPGLNMRSIHITEGDGVTVHNVVSFNVDDEDADDENELQTLSLSGTELRLSNSPSVDLSNAIGATPWYRDNDHIYYNDGPVSVGMDYYVNDFNVRGQISVFEYGNELALETFDGSGYYDWVFYNGEGTATSELRNGDPGGHLLLYDDGGDPRADLFGGSNTGILTLNASNGGQFRATGNDFFLNGSNGGRFVANDYNNGVRIGINKNLTNMDADFHILQSTSTFPNPSSGGILLENNSGDRWNIWNSFPYLSFAYDGTRVGYINSGTGAYTQTSDKRFKKNIKSMHSVLDKVMELRPVTYQYNHQEDNSQATHGFIAQEVVGIFPDIPSRENDSAAYGIPYSAFSTIAIKAIQEQQETIQDLNTKVETLESNSEKMMKLIVELQEKVADLEG